MLDKSKILAYSREKGGERYTKRFNCWIHLVVMLYAVIMRFDSLRGITASLLGEGDQRVVGDAFCAVLIVEDSVAVEKPLE